MKALLIIDHFGSGGAQRQIVELARGLKARGHLVEMFIYYPQYRFFRRQIDEVGIRVHEYAKHDRSPFAILFGLVAVMRKGCFDVAVSYLDTPNVYASTASFFVRRTKIVVSERSSYRRPSDSFPGALARRLLHCVPDCVVTNNVTNANLLRQLWWLRRKVTTIYNGIDLEKYRGPHLIPTSAREMRLLGIGRVGEEKNIETVIEGLEIFRRRHGYVPQVAWAGKPIATASGEAYAARLDVLLDQHPEVKKCWSWLGEREDVASLIKASHAVIHASHYEGLPNAVCEALASGRPVLASRVCDHPLLIEEPRRGFLFRPDDPSELSDALLKLASMKPEQWRLLAANARDYAETNLSITRMVDRFEALFEAQLADAPRA